MDFKTILHPLPGCIIEFMQGNEIQCACVLENQNDKIRAILLNRREVTLPISRVLPWMGPQLSVPNSKDEAVSRIDDHISKRKELEVNLAPNEWWELAQGELKLAPAEWFADLTGIEKSIDLIAACAHVLLACKTHFKFQPPVFEIFDADTVDKRLHDKDKEAKREVFAKQGNALMHALWDNYCKSAPPPSDDALSSLDVEVVDKLKKLIVQAVTDPNVENSQEWITVTKQLPRNPMLSLHIAQAWGVAGPHHNIWMDRAGYDPTEKCFAKYLDEIDRLIDVAKSSITNDRELDFISIDDQSTNDIDDAFYLTDASDGGWHLTLALACIGYPWDFDSEFDTLVRRRATSIYLPEGTYHMLPQKLSTGEFSLFANVPRPALVVDIDISSEGEIKSCTPSIARVRLAANLHYTDVESALDGVENDASKYRDMLISALKLAEVRLHSRVNKGKAVVLDRPEILFDLHGDISQKDVKITSRRDDKIPRSHLMVAEQMITANCALATWAHNEGIPLFYRGQNIRTDDEIFGIWQDPLDIARVIKYLSPAIIDTEPHPHASIGAELYAPVTSPLRRYTDLFNEAQIMRHLEKPKRVMDKSKSDIILTFLHVHSEASVSIQRMRTRYWKFVYITQHQSDLWQGIITDINLNFVYVILPEVNLTVRGAINQFPQDARLGMSVCVKLGGINPWMGEVSIIEVQTDK